MVPELDLESIATERLVSDQSTTGLAPLLTTDQRALISVLATAELHQIDAAPLLHAYAAETKSIAVEGMADRIEEGRHPIDAAIATAALPRAAEVALSSSRASGSLDSFYRCWLSQSIDDDSHWVPHHQTNVAKVGRAFLRLIICFWMLAAIILTVVPEFAKMQEEFGLPWTSYFNSFVVISDKLLKVFVPCFTLFLLCWLLYVLFFNRTIANNYFRRWLPSRWQQIVLPKNILNRKLLAWDLLAFRGNPKTNLHWDHLVANKNISQREADILQLASSRETQAWLLRRMTDQKHLRQRTRRSWKVDGFILLLQLLVAALTILAAFAIFSTLLGMMESFT